jgi:hypothetical protein
MFLGQPEPPPFSAPVRRAIRATGAAVFIASVSIVFSGIGYVKLGLGWHPIPSTAIGCSLHKRFHSFNGAPIKSENLGMATDCLKVAAGGRETIVRDSLRIAAIRAWFDSRADLWRENILTTARDPGPPIIVIRACDRGGDHHVYVSQDWIGYVPSKTRRRPVCREEWRELAAIIVGAEPTGKRSTDGGLASLAFTR